MDLPSCFDAVEVGAVEGAGEDPELGEAEAVGFLDGRIPNVDGGLGAKHRLLLLRRRRVRDGVLPGTTAYRKQGIHRIRNTKTSPKKRCVQCEGEW